MKKQWSENSRNYILNVDIGKEKFPTWKPGISGFIYVKHIDGEYGFLTYKATEYTIISRSKPSNKKRYSSMKEVIDAGWVAD